MIFVDNTVARRLEEASAMRGVEYARAQARLRPETQAAAEPFADGYAVYAGPGSPANRAVGLGMQGPVTRGDVAAVRQFYRARGELPYIQLCPLAHPSLLELLREGGYHVDHFYNVLALPVEEAVMPAPDRALRVGRAAPDQADLWIRTVAEGFRGGPPTEEDLTVIAPNFHSAIATSYFAWADGEPAGGGSTIVHGGVAELCSASTRLPFRRRGIQAALIHARLAACRATGVDLAMVFTSPGTDSQRNVEKAGFRVAYSDAVVVAEA